MNKVGFFSNLFYILRRKIGWCPEDPEPKDFVSRAKVRFLKKIDNNIRKSRLISITTIYLCIIMVTASTTYQSISTIHISLTIMFAYALLHTLITEYVIVNGLKKLTNNSRISRKTISKILIGIGLIMLIVLFLSNNLWVVTYLIITMVFLSAFISSYF